MPNRWIAGRDVMRALRRHKLTFLAVIIIAIVLFGVAVRRLYARNGSVLDRLPVILAWTPFMGESLFPAIQPSPCPELQCNFTDDRRLPPYFFNATITYRRDSDFPRPYGGVYRLPSWKMPPAATVDDERRRLRLATEAKRSLAVSISSNCDPPSGRKFVIQALSRFTGGRVDVWGHCGRTDVCKTYDWALDAQGHDPCVQLANRTHKFLLAFENNACMDYVTEKVWHRWRFDMVLVVLRRSIVSGLLPDSAFIAVDDFTNMREFANHLIYLDKDTEAYLRYFDWRTQYESLEAQNSPSAFCNLCAALHNGALRAKSIENIYDWWVGKAQCESVRVQPNGSILWTKIGTN